MPRKKTIELQQTHIIPSALIIGENNIAPYLAAILEEHGCTVTIKDTYRTDISRFDYIFQFDNFGLVDRAVQHHLLPGGKFLFIETNFEPNITKKDRVRIIRTGDTSLWPKKEIVDKILHTIFSVRSPAIVDVGKKSTVTVKPTPIKEPVYVTPPIIKKPPSYLPSQPAKKTRVVHKKRIVALGLAVLIVSLVCAGAIYGYVLSLKKTVASFRSHLASADWPAVTSDIRVAKQQLSVAENIYNFSSRIFFPLSNTDFFQNVGSSLEATDNFFIATDDFFSFSKTIMKKSSFFSRDEGITKAEVILFEKKANSLYISVLTTRKELEKVNFPFFPKENSILLLSSAADKLAAGREILPIIEKLFFDQQTKVYLVLFQNSMELRPTGGFIGSFALLNVENGKIIDFKIEDVYTADGQLKGHIDPPLPIRKYLSQPHFFLRDSNFDPDFAIAAVKAAWFLEKELGRKVDGVIAINLPFVQKILRAVGSLTIADFNNEKIDADNFFFKTHSFTSKNFFPGSTQKKDFLISVANALMQKLSFGEQVAWLDLFAAVKQALEEKNILIYTMDENTQKFIEEQGWGGRIIEVKCVQGKERNQQNAAPSAENQCIKDYLSIIEANLGVNKANYFINKSVTVEKKIIDNGKITSIVTLAYENTAQPEVFPDTTYVNYLRIFVPQGSNLEKVTLNNIPLATSDIDIENYSIDKTVYGFLVKTAPGNKEVVKITYTLPYTFDNQIASYQFFFQKQAGDKNSPLVLSISLPSELKLKPVNFKSRTLKDEEIFYTTDTSVDRIFAFEVDH